MIKRAWKARPHDLDSVMKFNPEVVEIHASSEDLDKEISGRFDVPLVVHFPEYDGENLMDAAALEELPRLKAEAFYNRALSVTRKWGQNFKGTPKAIIHPGGMSSEPRKAWERPALYDAFKKTMDGLNQAGVDLLVENMPPQPWFYSGQWFCNIFMDPKECLSYCTANGWSFCFDACHAKMWCNSVENMVTLEKFASIVRPVTAHLHLSDAKGVDGEGVQIGEGDIDWASLMGVLKGMNVPASCECWQGHKDNFAGFRTFWERLEPYLKYPATAPS